MPRHTRAFNESMADLYAEMAAETLAEHEARKARRAEVSRANLVKAREARQDRQVERQDRQVAPAAHAPSWGS